jgi:predicted lipoprotein with Yx(FWY)xxD motif
VKQGTKDRNSTRKLRLGRVGSATLALGALSGLMMADATAGAATSVVVSTSKNAKLGTILVSGKTVYTLKASKISCNAACLKVWPPLLLPKGMTKAKAGSGVSAAKLGTVKRSGGALQVTYAGKPLYWFVGDTGAGQVHGNVTDTWGKWSAVVTAKPTSTSSGTGSGSGSGGSTAGSGGVSF